jgi:hypothetical protein
MISLIHQHFWMGGGGCHHSYDPTCYKDQHENAFPVLIWLSVASF